MDFGYYFLGDNDEERSENSIANKEQGMSNSQVKEE